MEMLCVHDVTFASVACRSWKSVLLPRRQNQQTHLPCYHHDDRTQSERNPLECAARRGSLSLVSLLTSPRAEGGLGWAPLLFPRAVECAAERGSVGCVARLRERGASWSGDTFLFAARSGSVEVARYLRENGCVLRDGDLEEALESGRLELVKYLHEECGCGWGAFSCSSAARSGNLECLKYCKKSGAPWEMNLEDAGVNAQLDLLEYIEKHCIRWSQELCASLVTWGHLELLRKLHEEFEVPLDELTAKCAAAGGHVDCLQYARENGCPWDVEELFSIAVKAGSEDCAKYCLDQGCEVSDDTSICAWAAAASLGLLRDLRERGFPWDTGCYQLATVRDRLDVLQYLHENGCQWEAESFQYAPCHLRSLRFCHELGCPLDEDTCAMAACNLSTASCLAYAREHGCLWDDKVMLAAARVGSVVCLKYGRDHGLALGPDVLVQAIKYDSVAILAYAHDVGYPWDEGIMRTALDSNGLLCFRYCLNNGCPWDSGTLVDHPTYKKWVEASLIHAPDNVPSHHFEVPLVLPCDDLIDGTVPDSILWMCNAAEHSEWDLFGFLERGPMRLHRDYYDDFGNDLFPNDSTSNPLFAVLLLCRPDLFELLLQAGVCVVSLAYPRNSDLLVDEHCFATLLFVLDADRDFCPHTCRTLALAAVTACLSIPTDAVHILLCGGVETTSAEQWCLAVHQCWHVGETLDCFELIVQAGTSDDSVAGMLYNFILSPQRERQEIASHILHLGVIDLATTISWQKHFGYTPKSFLELIAILGDPLFDCPLPDEIAEILNPLLALGKPYGTVEMMQTLLYSCSSMWHFTRTRKDIWYPEVSACSLVGLAARLNQDDPDDLFRVELLLSHGARCGSSRGEWEELAWRATVSKDGLGMVDLLVVCSPQLSPAGTDLVCGCRRNVLALRYLLEHEFVTARYLAFCLTFESFSSYDDPGWSLIFDNCAHLPTRILQEYHEDVRDLLALKGQLVLFLQSGVSLTEPLHGSLTGKAAILFEVLSSLPKIHSLPDTETFWSPKLDTL